jgi:hypothetical protein
VLSTKHANSLSTSDCAVLRDLRHEIHRATHLDEARATTRGAVAVHARWCAPREQARRDSMSV